MGCAVQSSLFEARTYVTVVEIVTEIVIAITVISFAIMLLSSTTVVSVIITPIVAAPIVVVIIAVVVEAAVIITGGISTVAAVASVSSIVVWVATGSSIVHSAVAWAGGRTRATLTRPERSTGVLATPTSRARHGWAHGMFISLNHGCMEIRLQIFADILDFRGVR
jgi:hypothetical protein